MAGRNKGKIAFQKLASRLTGVSAFGFGANWRAPEHDAETVRNLIHFLEDRRALYVDYCLEIPEQVDRSLIKTREELTAALQQLPDGSPAADPIKMMRAAARKFLNRQYPRFVHLGGHDSGWRGPKVDPEFFAALGELRAIFGREIATLAYLYRVDVEAELASILPPDSNASDHD